MQRTRLLFGWTVLTSAWAWVVTAPVAFVGFATLVRDEFLPSDTADKWHIRSVLELLPDWPWQTYALLAAGVWVVAIFEAAYRAWRTLGVHQLPSETSAYLSVEEAGTLLYEKSGSRVRRALRSFVPLAFKTVNEAATSYVRHAATDAGVCPIYARWGHGMPLEELNPEGDDFSHFEQIYDADKQAAADVSIRRSDLRKIIKHYNASPPKQPPPSKPEPQVVIKTGSREVVANYPYRKAVLQLEPKLTPSLHKNGEHFTDAYCALTLRNTTMVPLNGCSIHVVSMACGESVDFIDRPLRPGVFDLPKLQSKRITFIHRDLKDIVSRSPHLLRLVGEEYVFADGRTYEMTLELRSNYEYPTRVVLDITTDKQPDTAVRAEIKSQTV